MKDSLVTLVKSLFVVGLLFAWNSGTASAAVQAWCEPLECRDAENNPANAGSQCTVDGGSCWTSFCDYGGTIEVETTC